MPQIIAPNATPSTGTLTLLGDKSLSHRALLFAALATGKSTIRNFPASGVTFAMLRCLHALGVAAELDAEHHLLTVEGVGLHGFKTPTESLDCGNSATTLRLLAGALAGAGIPCTLTGSAGLCKRPMGRIVDPLRLMGADITASAGCAPLTLRPAPLHGLSYMLPVASAQVKSCLLLAGLSADAPTALLEPGPSRDHTERMLAAMGARIQNVEPPAYGAVILPQSEPLAPLSLDLPGDISSAAFLILRATLIPGSDLTLRNICINPTRTGFIEAMQRLGADITLENPTTQAGEPVADLHIRHPGKLRTGGDVTFAGNLIVRMIDEVPTLMIAATQADHPVTIREAAELRAKESDRIAIMAKALTALGADITEYPDGFTIRPTPPIGGKLIETHGDHRVAMSTLLAAQIAEKPTPFDDLAIINESFPGFQALVHA